MSNDLLAGWPEGSAAIVLRREDGGLKHVASAGNLDAVRPWASVSKLLVAVAYGIEVDWEAHTFEETVISTGRMACEHLSHATGLGAEEGDPTVEPMTKRVYSNHAVDLLVDHVVGDAGPAQWLENRIFIPMNLTSAKLVGKASSGVEGSTRDLATFAECFLERALLGATTHKRLLTVYGPSLAGIVPGWGRFDPCPWGLGPEIRGDKEHWMGDWSPSSAGHFGASGAMLLFNYDEGIGVVATSPEPFGPWAVELWPGWTSAMRRLALEG